MDWIINLLPAGLIALGLSFQRKDKNTTGGDDAVGRAFISMAPMVTAALASGNDRALLRGLRAAREGIDTAIRELEAEGTV